MCRREEQCVVFPRHHHHHVQSFFSVIASGVNWVIVGLICVCRFVHVFIIIIVIFNGSEVRVMGTRSGFFAAGVFTLAFSAKPRVFV